MAPAIVGIAFFGLVGGFLTWRTFRMWRDPDYYQKVISQSTTLPVSAEVARGLTRGTAPLAAALLCAALFTPLVVYTDGGGRGVTQGPPALAYLEWALILVFLVAMAAHLCIAWFNRPKFLVPPYLRDEPGVREQRRTSRKTR
jgi:hypothetical protein